MREGVEWEKEKLKVVLPVVRNDVDLRLGVVH